MSLEIICCKRCEVRGPYWVRSRPRREVMDPKGGARTRLLRTILNSTIAHRSKVSSSQWVIFRSLSRALNTAALPFLACSRENGRGSLRIRSAPPLAAVCRGVSRLKAGVVVPTRFSHVRTASPAPRHQNSRVCRVTLGQMCGLACPESPLCSVSPPLLFWE